MLGTRSNPICVCVCARTGLCKRTPAQVATCVRHPDASVCVRRCEEAAREISPHAAAVARCALPCRGTRLPPPPASNRSRVQSRATARTHLLEQN
ncbi:unnamed protein product, partial [Iphiclides podalirius]